MDIEQRDFPERENKKQGRVVIKNAKAIQIGGLSLEDGQCVFLGKTTDGYYGLAGSFGLNRVDDSGNAYIDMIALGPLGEFTLVGAIIPSTDAGGIGLGSYLGSAARAFGLVRSYSFSTASDERLKKDIEPLPYGLDDLEQLQPVAYKFRKGEDTRKLGFIAQQVREVLPEVVDGSEETNYGVSYDEFIPVLVNAVKELSARVKELESRVL